MSTVHLVKGQNGAIAVDELSLSVEVAAPVDVAALLITDAGLVRSDADFVFYNQPVGPGVQLRSASSGRTSTLIFALAAVPIEIDCIRILITLDTPEATFGQLPVPMVLLRTADGAVIYDYRVTGLGPETILVAAELYRRTGWKFRAVGQGYAGGLAELLADHGVEVDDEPEPVAVQPPTATPKIRTVFGEERLSWEKRAALDFRKREVANVLLSKGIEQNIRARVVVVIDKTGSMRRMYRDGTVQRVIERMVPIAIQLDDDGNLEPYLYAADYAKLPDISVDRLDAWSAEYLHLDGRHGGIDYKEIGGSNNELPVMRAIIATLDRQTGPTLVLFFTDGGFREKSKITALMREASHLPAFWQFIGLGHADYGLLYNLDTMTGRHVDNAGFFAVDDIDNLSDAQLYRRLLTEFPDWLRAARQANVLRNERV